MKRIYVGTLLCIILSLGLLTGCDQGVARSLGGDMTLELEPGQKLEMITWKEDSLWYLTRPMRDDEEPETHTLNINSHDAFSPSTTDSMMVTVPSNTPI